MELNYLHSFYEVAKAGSFSAAARTLRTSQSSLSKSVALLEHRQGVKLLERSKKGVLLTSIGEEIFELCHRIFSDVKSIEDRIRGKIERCEGFLRFGVSDHIAKYFLVGKLQKMRELYPLVTPSIFIGGPVEILSQIQRKELEFGLFFTRIKVPEIEYKRVAPFELILVASSLIQNKILPHQIGDIGILGSISREYQRHPSHRIFELTNSTPKINIETNSQDFQKQLCVAGQGCVLLAKFMVEEELRDKTLVQIPLPKPITVDLLLAKRKQHALSRQAQVFIKDILNIPGDYKLGG